MITDTQKARAREKFAGPYMNDDGDWWFPTSHWTWNLAQAEAKDFAGDSESTAVYDGTVMVVLCDDHDPDDCEGGHPPRRAYHFHMRPLW